MLGGPALRLCSLFEVEIRRGFEPAIEGHILADRFELHVIEPNRPRSIEPNTELDTIAGFGDIENDFTPLEVESRV